MAICIWNHYCFCYCSVAKSCSTLCSLIHCSIPGSAVLHHVLELAQICVCWVCDAVQLSHPLPHPSPFAFNFFLASVSFPVSWLFTWNSQSVGASASVLPMNIQGWLPLGLAGLISLQPKGFSRIFSNTTIRKHQFFDTQPSFWCSSYPYVTTGKTTVLCI